MVQLRGNCKPRKKNVFYCFNFEIRVSWSLNLLLVCGVPHRTMPTLLQWGLWDSLAGPASCRRALWLTAELPWAWMFCILEGSGADGQGGLLFRVCIWPWKKSFKSFQSLSYQSSSAGLEAGPPPREGDLPLLKRKANTFLLREFRWVWVQIPVLPLPSDDLWQGRSPCQYPHLLWIGMIITLTLYQNCKN